MGRLFFLYFWAVAMSLAIAGQDVLSPNVDEEQIDSTGLVWAAKHYGNQLYTYDGQSWSPVPNGLNPDIQASFRGMVKTADGAVVVAWVIKGQGLAVTRHSGTSSTVLGSEKGDDKNIPNLIHPTIDSKGRVWMSGSFPGIYRTDGNGGIALVQEFTPEDFRSREKKRMLTSSLYNPIHCDEDGLGRMWVWSGTIGSIINQWGKNPNLDPLPSLHGVYIVSEDKWELHDDLGAIKGADIYSVNRFDDQNMIVSDSENGVYKLDIQSWKTENLPGPSPLDLRNVHELFVDGSDIYALDRTSGTQLWRWSNKQWSEVILYFEHATNGVGHAPRPRLRTREGLIVQGFDHTWFLPNTGPAKTLSWKSAFPISRIKAIVQLKDGRFCVLATESGAETQIYYCEIADTANVSSISQRIVEVEPDQAWLNSKRIWMIPRQDPTVLKEWNGKNWLIHPLPNKVRDYPGLNEDDQGRIWIFDGTVSLFDPVKNQWQSFSSLDDCLTTTKGQPVHLQHIWGGPYPRYSSDKQRIAYCSGFFDGPTSRVGLVVMSH